MNSDLLHGFELGDIHIDPLQGNVTSRGGTSHLHPKAVEVLLALATRPGNLVTRETLLEEVWGKGRGSQETLRHAVSEIRHALDDHANQPRFIQTLPKRGYRLLVEPVLQSDLTSSFVFGGPDTVNLQKVGFIENLKRRGVLETTIAYLLLGWLLIQIADIVFAQLLLPPWAATFVTYFVISGFPIALILSWFLEFRDGKAILHELSRKDEVRRRFSRTYISVIGALALAAGLVFVYDQNVGLPNVSAVVETVAAPLPPVADNSFAVLPFLNIDGSEDTQIFSNGLTDDLITRLSRVPGLLVSSRGDAYSLQPNSVSKNVRARLRVAHYLEGSVQIAGDKLRIIVQMIDSATGFHVMSRRFDRPREDFFEIRNEITELTVANVQVALPADAQSTFHAPTQDPSIDAYVLYRRGRDALDAPTSMTTIDSALRWFDEALQVDPDYAAAHAGKCEVYVNAFPETDNPDYIERAQSSCSAALTLNPNLDVVHSALGTLYHATGKYAAAESAFVEALRINANSVVALTGIGSNFVMQSRMAEAEDSFRKAIGLHPGDWFAYSELGRFLYNSGRYAESAEQYETVVALDSSNASGYSNLGTAYLLADNFSAAATALEKAIELDPRANTYSSLGLMHYYLGRFDRAVAAHQKAVELAPNDHLNWSNLGDALLHAGNKVDGQQAFATAERLVANAVAVNPNDPNNLMDLAWISSMLDKEIEAITLIEKARQLAPDDPYVHYINGLILLRAGRQDDALAALNRAAVQGYSLQMMAAEPHLSNLVGHPVFQEILSRRR